ncbi:MAG: transglutaminase-like domain-containing protein, partial [Oscillospiraceae bacterium]|nr:transglutaminase-like domain-containing protein [Oscillospiraceae bacterium]
MKAERRPSAVISASIHADKKLGKTRFANLSDFAPIAVKFILSLCGCIGSAMTFLTCLNPGMSLSLTAAAAAVLCLVFTFIFSLKEKLFRIVSLLAAAALIIVTYIFRYDICAGFAAYLNIFFSVIREGYRSEPFILIAEPELAEYHIRVFSLFADCVMCAFACHSAVRGNSASGVCLSTCMPVFAVLMYGLEPNLAAFFAVVVCWTAMFALESNAAEAISDPRCKKYSSYCGFCTAVIAALCIAALPKVSKMFGYERPEKLNIMYDEAVDYISGGGVQQVIEEIVTIATRNVAPTGAINHGKLGEFDEISFDGRTVLEVTIPKSDETIYLRGFVGSVYTGRSWEQFPSAKQRQLDSITESFSTEGLSPLLLDGYNLKYTRTEMPQHSFSVKNVAANTNYLYMPYNLVPESVSRYKKNSGGFGGASKSYIGQFYDPASYYGYQNIFRVRWSTPAVLSEDEAAYRSFVYANYLDIPESFSPTEIFDESYYEYITAEETRTGKSTLDEMTVFSRKLYFIKKWLRDNCEYSLTAGKLPAGKDFAQHFLETREGSCSHFATAAVIMCRYAGIPARYAEGYIIKPADFPNGTAVGTSASVSVSDLRGHAWAEVYLDGFGWYPVEFTSGYGNVRTAIPTETTVSETETETETELSESPEEDQPHETDEEIT